MLRQAPYLPKSLPGRPCRTRAGGCWCATTNTNTHCLATRNVSTRHTVPTPFHRLTVTNKLDRGGWLGEDAEDAVKKLGSRTIIEEGLHHPSTKRRDPCGRWPSASPNTPKKPGSKTDPFFMPAWNRKNWTGGCKQLKKLNNLCWLNKWCLTACTPSEKHTLQGQMSSVFEVTPPKGARHLDITPWAHFPKWATTTIYLWTEEM